MQIPSYAKPTVDAYQASGTLKGNRTELDRDTAEASLQSLKDEFSNWQQLDESEFDLLKGKPGEVRLASHYHSGGYTEARFSGDTQNGQLAVLQNDPITHYGFASYQQISFTPQAAESLSMQYGNNTLLGPQLLHIERELSSGGPVVLSGEPVSVSLTDHARSGYAIYQG